MMTMAMKSAAATPHTSTFCCISRLLMLWIRRRAVLVSPPTSSTCHRWEVDRQQHREEGRRDPSAQSASFLSAPTTIILSDVCAHEEGWLLPSRIASQGHRPLHSIYHLYTVGRLPTDDYPSLNHLDMSDTSLLACAVSPCVSATCNPTTHPPTHPSAPPSLPV